MANVNVYGAAILDSETTVHTGSLVGDRAGSLLNKGPSTVYLQFDSASVTADDSAGIGKTFLDAGDAMRIPSGVRQFAHATASGTAKLLFVEA